MIIFATDLQTKQLIDMRKNSTCLSAILLILPLCSLAQELLFPTGTVWKEVSEEFYVSEYPESYTPVDTLHGRTFEIGQDTLIGGKAYKGVSCNGGMTDCFIREEDNCVWMLYAEYPQEFKLYDFSQDEKGTVTTQYLRARDKYESQWELEDEELPGSQVKTADEAPGFVYVNDFEQRTIIKGVGCVSELNRNSSLLGYYTPYIIPPGLIFRKVLWLRRNGQEVYRYLGKNEWVCNVESVTDVESVVDDSTDQHEGIFDLQGRRLAGEPDKGMYIKDGRKYVR